jgi:hypothetical protein
MRRLTVWLRAQKYSFLVLLLPVWAYGLYFVITSNPTDSEEKLSLMKSDITQLLEIGGTVIERSENAKYGGAYISLLMSEVGWSEELMERYAAVLTRNGWVRRNDLRGYCFSGMKLVMTRHSGMKDGIGVNYIGMTYNAQTIRDCRG